METNGVVGELVNIYTQLKELRHNLETFTNKVFEITRTEPVLHELYAAFAKAKVEYKPLRSNRVNTFNKQPYADLEAIFRATDAALSKYELVFYQEPRDEDGTTFLYSTLAHASGQKITTKNRLIIPAFTGAKSDSQRFAEALANLKRHVAKSMLSIAEIGDAEDADDAETSELLFMKQTQKAMAGDDKPAAVDQGILSERITKDQLQELYLELEEYPVMTKNILKGLELQSLADMPKARYWEVIKTIRSQKIKLMNAPKSEW